MGEPQYTVFIRVNIPRRGFVDPPPVDWNSSKDEELWKMWSGAALKEVDWNLAAEHFEVPVDFLLQQVVYLNERNANHLRQQLQKATAAAKGSTAPSPVPGSEPAGAGHLRTPSALSVRRDSPMPRNESSTTGSAANVSIRPTISRNTSANTTVAREAGSSSPRIANKPVLRTTEQSGRKRLSSLTMVSPINTVASPITSTVSPITNATGIPPENDSERLNSPGPADMSSATSSDDESSPAQSRIIRRPPRYQSQETYGGYRGDEDDESEPAFQPYKAPSNDTSSHDLGSTLRGDGKSTAKKSAKNSGKAPQHSQTSDSSASSHAMVSRPGKSRDQQGSGPLSPRRTNELSGARSSRDGSDGSPSMGSSFSDLDDASVTQSALEEALASHMNRGGASRFSISQAFRSRYTPNPNQQG